MLLRVRRDYAQQIPRAWRLRAAMRAFAWVASGRRRFGLALRALAWGMRLLPARAGWATALPGALNSWTSTRHFPAIQPRAFRRRVRRLDLAAKSAGRAAADESPTRPLPRPIEDEDLVARFQRELEAVGGEVQRVPASSLSAALANAVKAVGASQVFLAWQPEGLLPGMQSVEEDLRRRTTARFFSGGETRLECSTIEQAAASVGVTAAVAALADTGTIVVASGPQGAQDASLLPGAHVAVLSTQDIFPSLTDWLERGGRSLLAERSSVTLITGPSRTADIEMTLTIGVHGPSRLIVMVCDGAAQAPREPRL
jgi:L-lactate dehydrogenase complex protein LldG